MIRWKRSWPDPSEAMPVDVYPISNGEFIPPPPTAQQRQIMELQNKLGEEVRAHLGMSRRDFVRSAAAMALGMWAIQEVVTGGRAARALVPSGPAMCDLDDPTAQLANGPGEFIFDIQTHHVDPDGIWKVANPGFHAFFAAVWPQSNCGELDRTECLSRYHYIKEVYLDSSTTMGVLSAVPSSPERNPLPTMEAAETVQFLNGLAGDTVRAVMHQFVMPNRGGYRVLPELGQDPIFLQDELDSMTENKELYPLLRAWKCYTPWGDVPNASGWFHDSSFGFRMAQHAIELGVPVIATHKGFALPSFDQTKAVCRDIGPTATAFYDPTNDSKTLKIIVYHSGFNSEAQGPYPGDATADSNAAGVNGLVKSLRENGWSARHFAPGGTPGVAGDAGDGDPTKHANNPNVYGEIGSTWRDVMNRSSAVPGGGNQTGVQAAHLLGKLIYYVGPRRVVWGTDSLWYGSPQQTIVRLRQFPREEETEARRILAEDYHLPHALDGDVDDPSVNVNNEFAYYPGSPNDGVIPGWPTDMQKHPERSIRNGIFGRNAAVPYRVDPDAVVGMIDCNDLQAAKDAGTTNKGTPRETRVYASNVVYGPRTPKQLFDNVYPNAPWAP